VILAALESLAEKCGVLVEMWSVMLLLEIVVGSIVRSLFEKVAAGIPGSMKTVRERYAEIWVLGTGCRYIQSADVSSRSILTTYRLWM